MPEENSAVNPNAAVAEGGQPTPEGAAAAGLDQGAGLSASVEGSSTTPTPEGGEPAASGEAGQAAGEGESGDVGQDSGETETPSIDFESLQMPELEGFELNVEEYKEWATEGGFTQEQAQYLIDRRAQEYRQEQEAWNKLQEEQVNLAREDQEFGGEKFDANLALAAQALDKFGNDELRQYLDFTGAGNHPEVIRFFYKVAQAISEDTLATGGVGGGAQRSREEVLYGAPSQD